ncbi:hypothetical protein HBH56_171850 [Parastagonospora nodorum]|nr:hypothetical protein HBH56_171850 [Parastagonospora nodorum]KAH3928250.1 hypothetical protein HBH54_140410 [Parastagonospora nodorum]KAH3945470.1 hypothetical protein HBH53_145730 [Parastagonospora nodorum]KAH4029203.1 hypothetical protein HBI13_045800 [Parastagonospora nodorum]KAH4038102.1 hypothetical protein HBI09_063050 [Parastagonospora nodorum]
MALTSHFAKPSNPWPDIFMPSRWRTSDIDTPSTCRIGGLVESRTTGWLRRVIRTLAITAVFFTRTIRGVFTPDPCVRTVRSAGLLRRMGVVGCLAVRVQFPQVERRMDGVIIAYVVERAALDAILEIDLGKCLSRVRVQ